MQTIAERLETAHAEIASATAKSHRPSNSVKLLAVSKTKPVSDIIAAYEAGQRLFGENYVQEGVDKVQELSHLSDIEWHMIGPIQSNKTKIVAEHFHWVQSVSREKIARRLNDQRPPHLRNRRHHHCSWRRRLARRARPWRWAVGWRSVDRRWSSDGGGGVRRHGQRRRSPRGLRWLLVQSARDAGGRRPTTRRWWRWRRRRLRPSHIGPMDDRRRALLLGR